MAVLLLAAEATGLKGPVDEFLAYCFEEEDEHGDIMADVERILPRVREEVQVRFQVHEWRLRLVIVRLVHALGIINHIHTPQRTPADLEERKTSQMEVWKGCMAKLKKAARWGSAGKAKGGGRKKSKGGGDTASVASTGSGATAGAGTS